MAQRPVLLCYDGSANAARAIADAGVLLAPLEAVLLSVWAPVTSWEAYDPGALVSGAVTALGAHALGLDAVAAELAAENAEHGIELAAQAGFAARGRVERGAAWRTICEVAAEIDAAVIVLGARGLSRVRSALLGSVSSAVVLHAARPTLISPPPTGEAPAER